MIEKFRADFYQNFIKDDRWKYITEGLGNTIKITIFAVLLGIALGFLVAMIRSTYEKTHKLGLLNLLCNIYLTVIRGTPVVIQLMIIYFVVFGSVRINKVVASVLAFGINSGAYVAEIFRSGIMSIDNGQFEAGRSLGFNYTQTMLYIIMPQAFKNVLPALGNEFIMMLKETSLASTFFLGDLMTSYLLVGGATYLRFEALIIVGVIYLCLTFPLSKVVAAFERRMARGTAD